MKDFIIVGFGLAGLSFAEILDRNQKSYVVFENNSELSSRVAGGLYNPVILKRFTPAWMASEQLALALSVYKNVEKQLKESFITELPVLRRFNTVEEQNLWFTACDKPILNEFLSSDLVKNENVALDIPFQFGQVKHTGRIEVKKMLSSYLSYIEARQLLFKESFEHSALDVQEDYVSYKGIRAKNIIFCEGYGLRNNPFFNYLPLQGNKGEYIIIKSKGLQLQEAVKSSIFIIPLGDDLYKVGATYNRDDKTSVVTELAKEELRMKLDRFLNADYEIVDQVAGIRPTTRDRRPFVGTHREQLNLHIINGLGSRGILIGPYAAKGLYDYVTKSTPLHIEIDIKRFD
ncbi:NAD(P)/FAD-dependent oxidoreductase [Aquimarina sp. 433]